MAKNSGTQRAQAVDPLEDLKRAIKARLREECGKIPSWQLESDYEIDLRARAEARHIDSGTEDVTKLLFGQIDEVTSDIYDECFDYLADRADALVKETLEGLLGGEFAAQIEAVAERIDQDPESLVEELKEDGAFSASEMEVNVENDYTYTGTVAIVAGPLMDVGFFADGLFEALLWLRIPIESFLAACSDLIDEKQLTCKHPGAFDYAVKDLDEPEEGGKQPSLFLEYRACLLKAARNSGAELFFGTVHGVPAVDVKVFVQALHDWGQSVELYVHGTGSGKTVKQVSNEIVWNDLKRADTRLLLQDGVLSRESNPAYVGEDITLIAPLSVALESFSVHRERPPAWGEPILSDHVRAACELYRAFCKADRQLEDFPPKPDLLPLVLEELLPELYALADAIPAYRIEAELPWLSPAGFAVLADQVASVRERLVGRQHAPLTAEQQQSGLLNCLAPCNDNVEGRRDEALWLIARGADVNAALANGLRPVHLAARLNDLELVRALHAAGADLHAVVETSEHWSVDNALSMSAAALPARKAEAPALAVVDYLIAAGCRLPPPPAMICGRKHVERTDSLGIACRARHEGLLRSVVEHFPLAQEERLVRLNDELYEAGQAQLVDIGIILVDAGADVAHHRKDCRGNEGPLYEVLRVQEEQWDGESTKKEGFLNMLHAKRAKMALDRTLALARTARPA